MYSFDLIGALVLNEDAEVIGAIDRIEHSSGGPVIHIEAVDISVDEDEDEPSGRAPSIGEKIAKLVPEDGQ